MSVRECRNCGNVTPLEDFTSTYARERAGDDGDGDWPVTECAHCKGTGADPDGSGNDCPGCDGDGGARYCPDCKAADSRWWSDADWHREQRERSQPECGA